MRLAFEWPKPLSSTPCALCSKTIFHITPSLFPLGLHFCYSLCLQGPACDYLIPALFTCSPPGTCSIHLSMLTSGVSTSLSWASREECLLSTSTVLCIFSVSVCRMSEYIYEWIFHLNIEFLILYLQCKRKPLMVEPENQCWPWLTWDESPNLLRLNSFIHKNEWTLSWGCCEDIPERMPMKKVCKLWSTIQINTACARLCVCVCGCKCEAFCSWHLFIIVPR